MLQSMIRKNKLFSIAEWVHEMLIQSVKNPSDITLISLTYAPNPSESHKMQTTLCNILTEDADHFWQKFGERFM